MGIEEPVGTSGAKIRKGMQNGKLYYQFKDIVVEYDGERVLNGLNLEIHDKGICHVQQPQFVGKPQRCRSSVDCGAKGKATFFDGVRINDLPLTNAS